MARHVLTARELLKDVLPSVHLHCDAEALAKAGLKKHDTAKDEQGNPIWLYKPYFWQYIAITPETFEQNAAAIRRSPLGKILTGALAALGKKLSYEKFSGKFMGDAEKDKGSIAHLTKEQLVDHW